MQADSHPPPLGITRGSELTVRFAVYDMVWRRKKVIFISITKMRRRATKLAVASAA